jgi:diaminopimelate epimerase
MPAVRIVKANAYGNDFLLAPDDGAVADPPSFTRAACARHLGIGADGLILFTMSGARATMRLWNADGSASTARRFSLPPGACSPSVSP